MNLIFEHIFGGNIFKILADDTNKGCFAFEIRHPEQKEVSFSAIQLNNNTSIKMLFDGVGFDETWLITLSAFSAGQLFFQYLSKGQYPDLKGAIAVDIHEQKVLWEDKDLYFKSDYQNTLQVPEHYLPQHPDFETIKALTLRFLNLDDLLEARYAETKSYLFLEATTDKSIIFAVLDANNGSVILKENLTNKAHFFIWQSFLLLINPENKLSIYG